MLLTRAPLYIIRLTMPNQETLYEVAKRVATITLNRPDKLNAWTAVMEQEVRAAMAEAERDENVRVIVLTGAGRGFCAGADMSLLSTVATKGLDAAQRAQAVQAGAGSGPGAGSGSGGGGARADFQKKYSYFPAMSKPVIGAINGPAVGLGLVIALYCDLRFASDSARFIDGAEAFRMGLANQVYPQDVFQEKVREYATELAAKVSPRSLRVIKRQVYDAMFQTLAEAFDISEREMLASLQCEDFKEGVAHFVEKRAPVFTGK